MGFFTNLRIQETEGVNLYEFVLIEMRNVPTNIFTFVLQVKIKM